MRVFLALSLIVGLAGCDAASTSDGQSSSAAPVAYAHESNNQATLSGAVTGNAIVNYVAGREGWRSSVNVRGNLANGTYGFFVAGGPSGNAGQLVCTFTAGRGRLGCSADTDLPGFTRAEIRDSDGNVVASGLFARRGGNRETGGNGGRPFSTVLTGAAEVPGPGDPDGTGAAALTLNAGQKKVCFEIAVANIEAPLAAHIHEASADASGPVVVTLFSGAGSSLSGCVSADRRLIREIAADPGDYYVNVHNAEFAAGALRGQLGQ